MKEREGESSPFEDDYVRIQVDSQNRGFGKREIYRLEYKSINDNFSIYMRKSDDLYFLFTSDTSSISFDHKFKFPKFLDDTYKKYKTLSNIVMKLVEQEKEKEKNKENTKAMKQFDIIYEKSFIDLDKIILGIEDEQE